MGWFYRITFFLSKILPTNLAIFITEKIAELMYFTCYSKRKAVVISNLKIVYKNITIPKAEKMVMAIYKNFAKTIYEFLIMPNINKDNLFNYLGTKHKEYLDNAIKDGKGAIVLTAHLGNWEIGAAMLGILGYSPTIISLPQSANYTKNFFTKQRSSVGIKVLYLGESLKSMVSAIKKGEVVATPGDHIYSGESINVEFFGKQAPFPAGIFEIASRIKTAIIPAFCVREGSKYCVYFEPELKNGIQEWAQILERYIRKYPTQWFTFDKIWN